MRPWVFFLVLAWFPSAAAGGVHGPYLDEVTHAPLDPAPGEAVTVTATPAADAQVERIVLVHCRLDPSYACSVITDEMQRDAAGTFVGTIPWQKQFFSGTSWVGYNLTIMLAEGSTVRAPTESTPRPPAELAEGVGTYYFYALNSPATTPGAGPLLVLVGVALAGVWVRARHAP